LPKKNNQNQDQEPNGEELESSRVAQLEEIIAEKERELAENGSRISELEQAVASRDEQIAALKQSQAELENNLAQAISSYRALVIKSNPDLPEELIAGDSVEEIEKSLANAQALIDRVRERLETEIAGTRIPAGAPLRTPLDLSSLSPQEKIQYAIGERR